LPFLLCWLFLIVIRGRVAWEKETGGHGRALIREAIRKLGTLYGGGICGRVVGDGACAESGGNVDGIIERDRICSTFGGGPGGVRGMGGQEDVLHGGLENTLFFNGLFESIAGESERRGKLIAVKLRSLTTFGRPAQ
jgi:hypothetical protein